MLLAETRHDVLELRYEALILATGARERFLPFPGWTLPNVMGAGGLQALVKTGLPIEGKRVIVAGSGPLLPAVAAYLRGRGAEVLLIAEQASSAHSVAELWPPSSPPQPLAKKTASSATTSHASQRMRDSGGLPTREPLP